jgi:predicted transcriptional regulator YheO
MAVARGRIEHKHFRLDVDKIKRAQRFLKAGTQTETLERALDSVIAEHKRNRLTHEANERFMKSGIEITDVYGKLAE